MKYVVFEVKMVIFEIKMVIFQIKMRFLMISGMKISLSDEIGNFLRKISLEKNFRVIFESKCSFPLSNLTCIIG